MSNSELQANRVICREFLPPTSSLTHTKQLVGRLKQLQLIKRNSSLSFHHPLFPARRIRFQATRRSVAGRRSLYNYSLTYSLLTYSLPTYSKTISCSLSKFKCANVSTPMLPEHMAGGAWPLHTFRSSLADWGYPVLLVPPASTAKRSDHLTG